MRQIFLFALLYAIVHSANSQSKPPHELFDALLKKYVSVSGNVNYKGFIKDTVVLNQYLNLLSKTPPDEKTWTKAEQMVYWINAYNAFTIKLITKYYPIKSIKDIGSSIQIPFVNTPWDIKFIMIGKEKLDLNNIEHDKLRKHFDEPRIHMALVCASKSCPILLNVAYDPNRLEDQLNRQTKAFLADPFRNKISADKPQLSMVFDWYAMDFNKKGGSVRSFVNRYSEVKIKPDAKISHLDYDWGLNDQ
ncbi:MAG: DUF547 domain-containing protein [Cyclobacteriaceae bacterium]